MSGMQMLLSFVAIIAVVIYTWHLIPRKYPHVCPDDHCRQLMRCPTRPAVLDEPWRTYDTKETS